MRHRTTLQNTYTYTQVTCTHARTHNVTTTRISRGGERPCDYKGEVEGERGRMEVEEGSLHTPTGMLRHTFNPLLYHITACGYITRPTYMHAVLLA